ncbi:hypothetical protein XENOCAPTIV_024870 [Xenoophorus captivus]|uniref:Secreted protein n=1 Tax=Xenoophorus captivus TaxID=1517983 RepID=A0ABV0QUT1_9TELE
MWLLSVLVPLLRLYLCGIRVLLYQMFHRSFEMPGQSVTRLTVLLLRALNVSFIPPCWENITAGVHCCIRVDGSFRHPVYTREKVRTYMISDLIKMSCSQARC